MERAGPQVPGRRFRQPGLALLLWAGTALAPTAAWPETPPDPEPEPRSVHVFRAVAGVVAIEAALAVNAALAAADPGVYGAALMVLGPLGAASAGTEPAGPWVGFAVCEAIGAYNVFVLSDRKYSGGYVFRRNELAWHTGILVIAAGYAWDRTHARPKPGAPDLEVRPAPGGALLLARVNF